MLRLQTADNCLMCGRCAEKCPVGIDLNTLRVNSRDKMHNVPTNAATAISRVSTAPKVRARWAILRAA